MSRWKITSKSPEQTEQIGAAIARSLKGGEIIELSSDLGGGKTTFTRGLASGLGVAGNITSPTFVVSRVYRGESLELHHYDFYRLGEIGIMSAEIQEVFDNLHNITVIEWAGDTHSLLPESRLIRVELVPLKDENGREITVFLPGGIDLDLVSVGATKC